jgi:hypothetical protein
MTTSSSILFKSLVLVAVCLLSGITGYSYGVHSSSANGSVPGKVVAAPPATYAYTADADVMAPQPSWRLWPQLTDF